MCKIGLTLEYSRIKFLSLSRGCEIAQLFCSLHGPPNPRWNASWKAGSKIFVWGTWSSRISKVSATSSVSTDSCTCFLFWIPTHTINVHPTGASKYSNQRRRSVSIADIQQLYPSQTKIWEGGTKDEIRIFAALFKGVSTRFGLRTIEKCCENPDFIICSSFPNLRLGSIKLLQKIVSNPENQHIASHVATIICIMLQRFYKR